MNEIVKMNLNTANIQILGNYIIYERTKLCSCVLFFFSKFFLLNQQYKTNN